MFAIGRWIHYFCHAIPRWELFFANITYYLQDYGNN